MSASQFYLYDFLDQMNCFIAKDCHWNSEYGSKCHHSYQKNQEQEVVTLWDLRLTEFHKNTGILVWNELQITGYILSLKWSNQKSKKYLTEFLSKLLKSL